MSDRTKQAKYCPKCKAMNPVSARACSICSHAFPPDIDPPEPPPSHASASAAQPQPVVLVVPNKSMADTFLVKECFRQYRGLTIFQIFSMYSLVIIPVGIGAYISPYGYALAVVPFAMILYTLIQKPALRRRVAELGIDPYIWARGTDLLLLKSVIYPIGFVQCALVALFYLSCAEHAISTVHDGIETWQEQRIANDRIKMYTASYPPQVYERDAIPIPAPSSSPALSPAQEQEEVQREMDADEKKITAPIVVGTVSRSVPIINDSAFEREHQYSGTEIPNQFPDPVITQPFSPRNGMGISEINEERTKAANEEAQLRQQGRVLRAQNRRR